MACIDFARFTYTNNNMQNTKVLQKALFGESKLKNVIVCTVYNINGWRTCLRDFSFYSVDIYRQIRVGG